MLMVLWSGPCNGWAEKGEEGREGLAMRLLVLAGRAGGDCHADNRAK